MELEIWILTSAIWVINSEIRISTTEIWVLSSEIRIFTSESWMINSEIRVSIYEIWDCVLMSDHWTLSSEIWVFSSGIWMLSSEIKALNSEIRVPSANFRVLVGRRTFSPTGLTFVVSTRYRFFSLHYPFPLRILKLAIPRYPYINSYSHEDNTPL